MAEKGKSREIVEERDRIQRACLENRSFPQVPRNELRWVSGAADEVGYGVGVSTATCSTRRVRTEANRSAVLVQGNAVS